MWQLCPKAYVSEIKNMLCYVMYGFEVTQGWMFEKYKGSYVDVNISQNLVTSIFEIWYMVISLSWSLNNLKSILVGRYDISIYIRQNINIPNIMIHAGYRAFVRKHNQLGTFRAEILHSLDDGSPRSKALATDTLWVIAYTVLLWARDQYQLAYTNAGFWYSSYGLHIRV